MKMRQMRAIFLRLFCSAICRRGRAQSKELRRWMVGKCEAPQLRLGRRIQQAAAVPCNFVEQWTRHGLPGRASSTGHRGGQGRVGEVEVRRG